MGGFALGALGGAGDALREFGSNMQRGAIQGDLEKQRGDNELNRQKALLQFKAEFENNQRTQAVERVGAAKSGIINSALDEKYQSYKPADQSTWTAEQQAVVDQSRDKDRKSMESDINTDVRAAMKTGDMSVKDAAMLNQKDAANETRMAIAQLRMEALTAKTQAQYDVGMAKIESAVEKAKGGNKDSANKEMLSLIDGMRKDVASEASNLKGLYAAEIKDKPRAKVAEIDASYKPKFSALQKRRDQIQRDFNAMRERVGLPAAEDDSEEEVPMPAPASAALPKNRPPLTDFWKK